MLADVINLVINIEIMLLPAILRFADEASILVIHAVVAPVSAVSSPATASAEVAHSSHSEHAFVGGIELLAKHAFNIVFQGHTLFGWGSYYWCHLFKWILLPRLMPDHLMITGVLINTGVINCSYLLYLHMLRRYYFLLMVWRL